MEVAELRNSITATYEVRPKAMNVSRVSGLCRAPATRYPTRKSSPASTSTASEVSRARPRKVRGLRRSEANPPSTMSPRPSGRSAMIPGLCDAAAAPHAGCQGGWPVPATGAGRDGYAVPPGPLPAGPGVVPGEGPSGAPGGGATGAGALEVEGSEPGRAQPSSDCAGMPGTAPGATPPGRVPSLI